MNKTCGLIVNSSRGIIYVDKTENFAAASRKAAQEVQAEMAEMLKAILWSYPNNNNQAKSGR